MCTTCYYITKQGILPTWFLCVLCDSRNKL